jgi:hypothetical protein
MQQILEYIGRRTAELQSNPFIAFLNDTSVPARERLSAWYPCAAFFVFGFMDLNRAVLRYPEGEAAADPLKKAINEHLTEDSMHWPWYLSDLKTLGLDETMKLSEALRSLWGKENVAQRMAVYRLCMLGARATDPLLRYVLLAALESYAHLLFGTLFNVSEEYRKESGVKLVYLGATHFAMEPGHLANQHDDSEELVRQGQIDESTRAEAMEIAGAVWDVINERWREFDKYVQSRLEAQLTNVG